MYNYCCCNGIVNKILHHQSCSIHLIKNSSTSCITERKPFLIHEVFVAAHVALCMFIMQVLASQFHFLANRNIEMAVPPLLWPKNCIKQDFYQGVYSTCRTEYGHKVHCDLLLYCSGDGKSC